MSNVRLFRVVKNRASELDGTAEGLEKTLQILLEANLLEFFGVRFVGTEVSTGDAHAGRIDTLGLDENGCPVIIEYKRNINETVVTQGLYYLDWLADHHGDFEVLVRDRLGKQAADEIDWNSSRLICVAGDYTKYDEHAVRQIRRNIDLVRYRKYGDDLVMIELAGRIQASHADATGRGKPPSSTSPFTRGVKTSLNAAAPERRQLFKEIAEYLEGLGDDVTVRKRKFYWAFSRLKNFACLEARKSKILVHLALNPKSVRLVQGFTRDMRKVGHYGTGDLQVAISSRADFDRAKPLMKNAYEGP